MIGIKLRCFFCIRLSSAPLSVVAVWKERENMIGRQAFRLAAAVLLGLAVALGGAGSVSAAPQKEHRVALVIGNAKYAGNPLRNPVNDARAMARALRELGFDVVERTDISQREFNRAITQFRSKIGPDSVALFYYAGHGMQVRGNNYLIPVDAQISTEATVGSEAVNMDTVLQQLTEAGSRVNLVILDACRNNPYERRFRGSSGGLASMDAPKGTLIAYATAPGKVALDGEGANGLYTSELLKAIRKPGWQVEEVFKEVRNQVNRGSGDTQIPWESSSLTGRFYFSPPIETPPAPAPAVASTVPATAVHDTTDIESWRSAQRLDTEEAYRAYLQQYPQGRFSGMAKAAISKLRLQQQEKAAQAAAAKSRPELPPPEKAAAQKAPPPTSDKQSERLAMAKPTAVPSSPPPATVAPPAPPAVVIDPASYRPTSRPICRARDDLASFFKDEGLAIKLSSSLQFNKALLREKIEVRVRGGVATLNGSVSSEEHAILAGRLAAEASGINCVNNLLQVGYADR